MDGSGIIQVRKLPKSERDMICIECMHLATLKKYISGFGLFSTCKYCNKESMCIKEASMIDYISARVRESFRVIEELSSYEQGAFWFAGKDLSVLSYWEILGDNYDLGVDEFVVELVARLEDEFAKNEDGKEQLYILDDGTLEFNKYEHEWERFVQDVHHKHRFFNDSAKAFLDSLFEFACAGDNLKEELVTFLKPSDVLFRARKVSDASKILEFEIEPGKKLGPAPELLAGSQRMTPTGISAMYCAFEVETCLSEIRSVTGDVVVVGAFNPKSEMAFLNLKKLEELARFDKHPFEEGYVRASHAYSFLKGLIFKLSKPKGTNDDFSYISTQVVFEYLRIKFGRQISGVIFPSVQTGLEGTNIVIFPECALIESGDKAGEASGGGEATLAFKEDSIEVHVITAVLTNSTKYPAIMDFEIRDMLAAVTKG